MEKKSKFSEYFKLYSHALTDIDKVIASRWNKALNEFNLLDEDKKRIAEQRLEICMSCPFNSINAKTSPEFTRLYREGMERKGMPVAENLTPHYFTNRADSDVHCAWCGCDVDAKVLSMDSVCGMTSYNTICNGNEPLKWDKA
jgi:hypothetical protein